MRSWVIAAATLCVMAAAPAKADVQIIHVDSPYTYTDGQISGCCLLDVKLLDLFITKASPDGVVHFGGFDTPVFGHISASGDFSFSGARAINSDGFGYFETPLRVYVGAKLSVFTIASYTIQGLTGAPAVPEPSTWAMVLVGLGAAGYAMRRRNYAVSLQAV